MSRVLLHDEPNSQWLEFRRPVDTVATTDAGEVEYLLRFVESRSGYHGLWAVGFVSYDAAPAFDRSQTTRLTESSTNDPFPLLWFGLFEEPVATPLPDRANERYDIGAWQPDLSESEYHAAISKVKDYIRDGDTYQVNYTYRLRSTFAGEPAGFFHDLLRLQPRGYACYIETDAFAVASVSPELFFRKEQGLLTTRPMKGTAPRGPTAAIDDDAAQALEHSEKNRAENLMIVDMMRNDLNRIAVPGSVAVPSLFRVEKYPTVLQMTSTITAKTERSWSEVLATLFPCSSITGAPKVRTMEIISELESSPRGLYTGTIGYLSPSGVSQMSVAIRTATIDKARGQASYGIGGGIIWDSDPADEYRESRIKARVLDSSRRPPETIQLLETMLLDAENGISLLDSHLDRLADSARYFGIGVDMEEIRTRLLDLGATQSMRVRLIVSVRGIDEISSSPLEPRDRTDFLRTRLAVAPVDSTDPLLYHKTTNRVIYEAALRAGGDCDDVLLFNEDREVTEFTIGNVVVEIDGQLVTPPVASGLLPGTFRRQLLESGEICERTITIADLAGATAIFRINSVRGWEKAYVEGVNESKSIPESLAGR